MTKSKKRILIRAHLFAWWTPRVADVVNKYGANIAWFHTRPKFGILTIFARFGNASVEQQISLDEIESARTDVIAFVMRNITDAIRAPDALTPKPKR